MPRRAPSVPAEPGGLPAEIVQDLHRLQRFAEQRHERLKGLMGPHYRGNLTEDAILRAVLIGYAEGRPVQGVDCVAAARRWAPRATAYREIARLVGTGIILYRRKPGGRRAMLWPCERLVTFYAREMPSLREQVRQLFVE
jgi:hypothetical protein